MTIKPHKLYKPNKLRVCMNPIQPTLQMLDGQEVYVNFNCTTCAKIISQSDLVRHLEQNHDVFYKRDI